MGTSIRLTSLDTQTLDKALGIPLDDRRPKVQLREIGIDMFSLEERVAYLKRYGSHCMSFSQFQPGMHFFDISGIGYIAYRKQWGSRFVLADPVCDTRHREYIVREFLKDRTNTNFIQISEPFADLLHEKFSYYTTQLGIETIVDLKKWDLKGKKKQVLRTSINKAHKDGVRFVEMSSGKNDDELSREWIRTRTIRSREVVFLIRTKDQEYQEGTRRFYAYLGEELLGFIHFDPAYEDGKVIAYVPNISRFSPKFKQGIFYPLMVYAMDKFKEEGIPYLFLGISPTVVDLVNDKPSEPKLVKMIVKLLYRYGNMFYSFKGLHFTKSRFQGREVKTFCAHKYRVPALSFLGLFRMCRII